MKKRLIPVIILSVFSLIYVFLREVIYILDVIAYLYNVPQYGTSPWLAFYEIFGFLLPMAMLLFIPLLTVGILKWKGLSLVPIPVWLYAVCSHFISFFYVVYQAVDGYGVPWFSVVMLVLLFLLALLCLALAGVTLILVNPFKKEHPSKSIKPGPEPEPEEKK